MTNGMNPIPARNALYPRMSCTYRPIVTVSVNITPPARKIAAKVATRLRSWNNSNGTTGFSAVRSTKRNAAKAASATTPEAIVTVDNQPCSGPIEKANTAAVQPSVASSAPAASSFSRSLLVSRSVLRAR